MPTVTSYRNGVSAGVGGGNPSPAKRGRIKGWTAGAVRRHTAWLYSINAPQLDGDGYALTLTMKDTPQSSAEFERIRAAWLERVRRSGATRCHWVVEWQRRGVPHIHAAVYYPAGAVVQGAEPYFTLITGWLSLTDDLGSRPQGQWWDRIAGAEGWLHYLSKHAARGVRHYQRWAKPAGWETTGRLWGYGGNWPVEAAMKFDLDQPAYWRFRRLVRAWRVADARTRPLGQNVPRGRAVGAARRMLACPQRRLSAVRGVSDWVPESVQLELIALLVAEGFAVSQRVDLDASAL